MRQLWHSLISGHQWKLVGQSMCRPDNGIVQWASKTGQNALAVKARYGWAECLLMCNCGKYVKIDMVGVDKKV